MYSLLEILIFDYEGKSGNSFITAALVLHS
jgi:hypothetical protein